MLRLSVDNERPLPLPQAQAPSEDENGSRLLAQLERIDLGGARALHQFHYLAAVVLLPPCP